MKKLFLIICCLLMAIILLPGGMASWGGDLRIEGDVSIVKPPAFESDDATVLQADKKTESEEKDSSLGEEKPYKLILSVSGQGSIEPEAGEYEYKERKEIRLEAVEENDDYEFKKWLIDNKEIETSLTTTIILDDAINVKAVFREVEKQEEDNDKEKEKESCEESEAQDDDQDGCDVEDGEDEQDEEEENNGNEDKVFKEEINEDKAKEDQ